MPADVTPTRFGTFADATQTAAVRLGDVDVETAAVIVAGRAAVDGMRPSRLAASAIRR